MTEKEKDALGPTDPAQRGTPAPAGASQPLSPDEAAQAQLIANLTFTRAADYKTIYSNVFRTRVGNGDITIVFSRATHVPSLAVQGNIIEEQVEIVMSWQQLKMLQEGLRAPVDGIDKEVGEITLPTVFKKNIDARAVIRGLGYPPPPTKLSE
jgi:hypothetical protein